MQKMKSNNERNTTCRSRVSGVQSGVKKSKGLYTRNLCDGAYLEVVLSFNVFSVISPTCAVIIESFKFLLHLIQKLK